MDYQQVGLTSHFNLKQAQGKPPLAIELRLPGRHNALNATAAMVVAQACDVSDQAIQQALADFSGVARRFQVHEGCTISQATDITVIDDNGHHPEEINVTLNTIADIWPDRRVVLLFQPHRFSRTQDLFEDFVQVLKKPDALILLDIYPASEAPLEGITSQALADAIGNTKPVIVTELAKVTDVLPQQLKPGDILLIQGAGSIGHLVETLISSC
jgi:UDP-N-acetylmuramate--alanine ligase